MSKLTNQIREYVRCPQFDGGTEYGEWGALRLDQRRLIRELCERCEEQEKFADTFFKETQLLNHQLAEKDEELAELKDRLEYIEGNSNGVVQVFDITDHDKEIRHQVCEEIRHKAKWRNPPSQLEFIISAKDLKQIEQGERK